MSSSSAPDCSVAATVEEDEYCIHLQDMWMDALYLVYVLVFFFFQQSPVVVHCCYEFLAIDQPAMSGVLCAQVHLQRLCRVFVCSYIELMYIGCIILFRRTIKQTITILLQQKVNSTNIISHDKNMRIKSIF